MISQERAGEVDQAQGAGKQKNGKQEAACLISQKKSAGKLIFERREYGCRKIPRKEMAERFHRCVMTLNRSRNVKRGVFDARF